MRIAFALTVAAAAAAWACWLAAVPALTPASQPRTGAWAAAVTYRAGAIICHQRTGRSLHVAGVPMPVCARCFGLYAGGAIGAALAAAWLGVARRFSGPSPRVRLAGARWGVAACGLPTLAAWAGEHLGGLAVTGEARALMAVPLGAAVAAIVTAWAGGAAFDDRPAASALHS